MSATDAGATALGEVERRLDRFFDDAATRAADHPMHYQALWVALRSSAVGGKRLRPRLALAACHHLGSAALAPAVELATAIELLHTALLLHDDVIDGDLERRGQPNLLGTFSQAARSAGLDAPAARRWGESAAILAGDLLLTAAVRLAAGLEIDRARRERLVALVDESVFRAAAGELADIAYAAGLGTPTSDEIRQMMADKTAHYSLELPLRAGAILAGSSDAIQDRLGEIGRSLGILFQMQDDLLGVFGATETTGKSTKNDLREGKQTLLVAFARETPTWSEAATHFGRPELGEPEAAQLRRALESSGARERFETEIRRQQDATLDLIRSAGLPEPLAELLAVETAAAAERSA